MSLRRLVPISGPSCLLLLAACAAASPPPPAEAPAAPTAAAEVPAGPLLFESERGPVLLGAVTRGDILKEFEAWAEPYAAYEPDARLTARLRTIEAPVEIVCILGTWCSDSEEQVPRFWKLLDAVDNPQLALRMLAVGRSADAAAADALAGLGHGDPRDRWDVELVPTFVFRLHGREIGRIVETPEASLEADAVRILLEGPPEPPGAVDWR